MDKNKIEKSTASLARIHQFVSSKDEIRRKEERIRETEKWKRLLKRIQRLREKRNEP